MARKNKSRYFVSDKPESKEPQFPADNTIIVKSISRKCRVTYQAGLNLRQEPDGKVIDVMPYNSIMEVKEVKGNWAFGSFNGTEGYAQIAFLKEV